MSNNESNNFKKKLQNCENNTVNKQVNNKNIFSTPDFVGVENNITTKNANNANNTKQNTAKQQSANIPPPVKSSYPTGAPKFDENRDSRKRSIISYFLSFIIASLMAFFIADAGGLFEPIAKRKLFGVLSDAFFVPGVLFLSFGILFKIGEGGLFDGVSFILRRVFLSFIPGARIKKEENFPDYKKRKEKKRRHGKFTSMFVIGGIFCVLALIFIMLYDNSI